MALIGDPDKFEYTADALRAADQRRLDAIHQATAPDEIASLLFDYYHDADRAARTSRSQMYLHLGMLTGLVVRLLDQQRGR